MVDLPKVSTAVVTSTAPRSSVSPGQIQGNTDLMANALGKVANASMDIATDMAKTQAADDLQNQKVTLSADGTVNVVNPANSVIFGKAGEAYNNAVQAGTIAQHSNVISTEMNDLHQKYEADPLGFKAASDAWKEQYLSQHGGGEVGQAIAQQADQLQTQHLNAITNTASKVDLATQNSALTAAQTSAQDDVFAMLRGGANLADPAVQSRIAQVDSTIAARAANPLFQYSKEQADLDREMFHSEAGLNRVLYDIDSTYKNQGEGGGYAGAMAKAQDILVNPGYKLSQQQREAYYHKATADIRANEAIRHQDVAEARAAFNELSMSSAAGDPISSDEVEHVAKAFEAAGDPGGRARVYSAFIRKPLNDSFGQQPLAMQTQQLNALHGANAAAFVNSALIAKGYSPIAAAGIVGNTVHESGVDPTAVGDNGTSGGIAQFHAERLANLKAFAAARGKPATDLQTQVDFIDHELHTTETGTLAKLQAARTPEEAGAAFIDYERPQGWTPQNPAGGLGYESRKTLARAIYDGRPSDMSMGPAGSAWLEANRQRTVATVAQTQWSTIMKDYNESNIRPSIQTVNTIVDAARASRNAALLDTIAHDSDRMDLAGQSARSPLSLQQSNITDLTAAGNAGQLTPGHATLITDLQRKYNAISEGLDKNPIATAVANFSDKLKDPGPLDTSSPESLAAGLQARSKIAQFAAQNWKTAPLSVLDAQDVAQMQAALQGPNSPAVLAGLGAGLQPQELSTLFDKTKLADSITGMSRSGDPAKMTAAFNFMDTMQKRNPLQFDQQFKDGLKDLLNWQSSRAFYPADVMAKKLEQWSSPQDIEARKASDAVANQRLKNISAANVVSKFSTGWGPIGTTANAPGGDFTGAAGALKADYDANYRDGFASNQDPAAADAFAMAKLRNKYGVSPTNGNRVMAYAPENPNYYPMVGGSYDWMAKQLDHDIADATGGKLFEGMRTSPKQGPRYAPPTTDLGAFASRQYQANRALIPDAITEADIAAKRPPSYQVVLQDPSTGRWGSLSGPKVTDTNLRDADAAMKLTPQEKDLYQRHLTNLTGPGGVDNPDGSRSTLFQTTVEHDGKFFTIPTVYDGKILWNQNAPDKAAEAVKKAEQIGWNKFPSYKTEDEAEARYQQMHTFMEKDTATYMASKDGLPHRIRFDPAPFFAARAAAAAPASEVLRSPANSAMAIAQ
jgi:Phage tail lysozyme